MDSIASFSAHKIKTSHFLTVDGILKDGVMYFLFDMGAICPLIGLNSLFSDDEKEKKSAFEVLLKNEISAQNILPRAKPLRTANNLPVATYPRVSHNVSIEGTNGMDFYFDFSFHDISLPLLGTSFTDDCSYSHSINGSLIITGMKTYAGSGFYMDYNVLDFDSVIEKFSVPN